MSTETSHRVRYWNENGEVACEHRDMSCCEECFLATPGLVDVGSVIYAWEDGEGWTPREQAKIRAGKMPYVRLSPGT